MFTWHIDLVRNSVTVSAREVNFKMSALMGVEHARRVLWFKESKSATAVQWHLHTHYHSNPPSRPNIYLWHQTFIASGCSIRHKKSPGRLFLMLTWSEWGKVSCVASQHGEHLKRLAFHMSLFGVCSENNYTWNHTGLPWYKLIKSLNRPTAWPPHSPDLTLLDFSGLSLKIKGSIHPFQRILLNLEDEAPLQFNKLRRIYCRECGSKLTLGACLPYHQWKPYWALLAIWHKTSSIFLQNNTSTKSLRASCTNAE